MNTEISKGALGDAKTEQPKYIQIDNAIDSLVCAVDELERLKNRLQGEDSGKPEENAEKKPTPAFITVLHGSPDYIIAVTERIYALKDEISELVLG